MTELTPEQIKTLEDAFASYPEGFRATPKFATMEGIQEQLKSLQTDNEGNKIILYITPGNYNEEFKQYGFIMHKMYLEGTQKS